MAQSLQLAPLAYFRNPKAGVLKVGSVWGPQSLRCFFSFLFPPLYYQFRLDVKKFQIKDIILHELGVITQEVIRLC